MTISVVAIGGPHGSGKSSVAKDLAQELGWNYVSAGEVFRQLAKERNHTLKEFSELVKEEPDIDREIDDRTKELGSKTKTIVDAQLAAHFTPKDVLLKICITASPEVRYKRIAKRESRSIDYARAETKIREKAEYERFWGLYQIDINDLSMYDVIINTDRIDEIGTFNLAKSLVETMLQS